MMKRIAVLCTGAALICRAAPVFWLPAKNIADTNDVITAGTFKCGVVASVSSSVRTINGVSFLGSTEPPSTGEIVLSGANASSVITAHYTLAPYISLSRDYKAILGRAWTCPMSGSVTGTVSGLIPGRNYSIQLWGNNSYISVIVGKEYRMTFVSDNSLSRILDYNVGNDLGLLGQHIVGHFTADEATQDFVIQASVGNYVYINAIQVREDVPLNCWTGTDEPIQPNDFDADGILVFDDIPGVLTNKISFAVPATNKLLWFRANNTIYLPTATNKLLGGDLFLSGTAPVLCIGSNTVSNVVIAAQSVLQYGKGLASSGLVLASTVWISGELRWVVPDVVSVTSAGVYVGGGTFRVDSPGMVYVAENQLGFTGLISVVSGTLRLGRNGAFVNARYHLERGGSCEPAAVAGLFNAKKISGSGKLRLLYITSNGTNLSGPVIGSGLQIELAGLPPLTNNFTCRVFSAPSVSGTFDLVEPDYGWYLSNPDGKTLWFKQGTGSLFRLK